MLRSLARALLAAAYALLLAGLVRGGGDARNRIPLPLRMASSALVWAAALLLWRAAPPGPSRARAGRAAAGMGCGLLGDLIMAQVLPLPQHVVFGMLAFGAGHVQYLRAAASLEAPGHERVGLRNPREARCGFVPSWPRVETAVAAATGVAGWRALAYSPRQPAPINAASLAYALLLSATAGAGAALAARDRRRAGLAAGGALFFASDLILAGEIFRGLDFPHIGDTIWLTYLAGQALIVDGLTQIG